MVHFNDSRQVFVQQVAIVNSNKKNGILETCLSLPTKVNNIYVDLSRLFGDQFIYRGDI